MGLERRALSLVLIANSAGCSLIFDFPDEGSLGGGPNGGGTAGSVVDGGAPVGGGSGGEVSACFGATSPATSGVVWEALPEVAGPDETVAVTGLSYAFEQERLHAFGNTTRRLQGFNMPDIDGVTSQMFVVALYDNATRSLLLNATPCGFHNGEMITRRAAVFPEVGSEVLLAGSMPYDDGFGSVTYSVGFEEQNGCGNQLTETVLSPPPGQTAADVPVTINTDTSSAYVNPLQESDGVYLDASYDDPSEILAAGGAAKGIVLGEPSDVPRYFLSLVSLDTLDVQTEVFADLYADTSQRHRGWSGSVAQATDGTTWLGGGACASAGGCAEPSAFLVRLRLGEKPVTVMNASGSSSAITALRQRDGQLIAGGHYRSGLDALGETLPTQRAITPFVVAIDTTNEVATWSHTPPADDTRWRSVVDVAVLGTPACGAVYVVGCSVPATAPVRDCSLFEPGSSGFIEKLDRATGALVWSYDFPLGDVASDLFVPTALASYDDPARTGEERLWMAATYAGSYEMLGASLETGLSRESVVLGIEP